MFNRAAEAISFYFIGISIDVLCIKFLLNTIEYNRCPKTPLHKTFEL